MDACNAIDLDAAYSPINLFFIDQPIMVSVGGLVAS